MNNWWDKVGDWFTRAGAKLQRAYERIRRRRQQLDDIAIVVGEIALEKGDWLLAAEPQDLPLLYGPMANYIVDAQAEGVALALAGEQKLLVVQNLIKRLRITIESGDRNWDTWWSSVGRGFLEAFVARAKARRTLGFKPSEPPEHTR